MSTDPRSPRIWHNGEAGRMPEGYHLVEVEVKCRECGHRLKEAGSRDSLVTWVETGFWQPDYELLQSLKLPNDTPDPPMEQFTLDVLHAANHLQGEMPDRYLLRDEEPWYDPAYNAAWVQRRAEAPRRH